MLKSLRDPVSGYTHLGGAILSLVGAVLMIRNGFQNQETVQIVGASIFGASLLLLYSASALYHLLPLSDKGIAILRRIDHMMIYVLIAGTYTPICLIALRERGGWALLTAVWTAALIGFAMKIFWFDAPRWFSTLFYVLMGAIVVGFLPLLSGILPGVAIGWIVAGGVLYIIGALIYATKLPILNFSSWFGFHEVFHLFILGGSFCHFWMIYRYILV